MDRVDELRRAASPLDVPLWDGVQYLLARGLAGLPPHDLYQSGALSFLATADPALQRHYRAAVVAEFADEAKVNRMAAQPEAVADLFYVWRRELNRTSRDWPFVVDELLRHTVGVVVRRMNDEQRGAVATRLARRSNNLVRNWLRWTNGVGDGPDTRIPGRPAPHPRDRGARRAAAMSPVSRRRRAPASCPRTRPNIRPDTRRRIRRADPGPEYPRSANQLRGPQLGFPPPLSAASDRITAPTPAPPS